MREVQVIGLQVVFIDLRVVFVSLGLSRGMMEWYVTSINYIDNTYNPFKVIETD